MEIRLNPQIIELIETLLQSNNNDCATASDVIEMAVLYAWAIDGVQGIEKE